MNDGELLAMAAKAADIVGRDGVYPVGTPDGQWRPWNPLEDDGDALRLPRAGATPKTRSPPPGAQSFALLLLSGAASHDP
jgi:hypothetical protein